MGLYGAQGGLQLHIVRDPDLLEPNVSADTAIALVIVFVSLVSGVASTVLCAVFSFLALYAFLVGIVSGFAFYMLLGR